MRRVLCLLPSLSVAACATSRLVVLEPLSPATSPAGIPHQTVYVAVVADPELMNTAVRDGAPALDYADSWAPPDLSDTDRARWDTLHDEAQARTGGETPYVVGWMRNGYGMHLADIYGDRPPERWLADLVAMELAAQGMTVVQDRAQADVVLHGVLTYEKIDIAMAYWADLVVDWSLEPKGESARTFTLHTHNERTAWSASAWEYYGVLRACGLEMAQAVEEKLAATRPPA